MSGKFEVKVAKNGKLHWSLKASNGQVILTSQMYASRSNALAGIESVKKNAGLEERFEKKASDNGKPYFVLKASNGQVIGQSQMYQSESARDNAIASVQKFAPDAQIEEQTG